MPRLTQGPQGAFILALTLQTEPIPTFCAATFPPAAWMWPKTGRRPKTHLHKITASAFAPLSLALWPQTRVLASLPPFPFLPRAVRGNLLFCLHNIVQTLHPSMTVPSKTF